MNITDNYEVGQFLNSYEARAIALKNRINDIIWYMRGSVNRSEAWVLSPEEQDYFVEKINEMIKRENTKNGI